MKEFKITLTTQSKAGFSDNYKPDITKTYFMGGNTLLNIEAAKRNFALEFGVDASKVEVVDVWEVNESEND